MGTMLLRFWLALTLRLAAAQTLRVAYIGSKAFKFGWEIAADKIASIGGFPVNRGAQTFGVETLEYMLQDTSSNPYLGENITAAVASAAAASADVILVGSSTINQRVMVLGEQYGIPNIHCSGGDPTFWQSTQPHSFGMHVPFTWYSKGAISAGKVMGLRTLAVLRTSSWGFVKVSGLAALEWARDAGYTVIGPTVQWCNAYANLTGSCRLVNASGGRRCVCAQQSEADSLGYSNLNIEEFPSLYEMQDGKILESDFGSHGSAKVSPNMASFVEGIIDDIRSQGADPDVVVCWVHNHRSVLYAASRRNLNPQMWVGVPNKAGRSWAGVDATMHGSGAQVLEATHAVYTVVGMQWSEALRLQDPVFSTNAEYVAQFQARRGRPPDYNEAACSAAGSVIYHALNKYTPSLDVADVALRRQSLRLGMGDLNDQTLYGMTRFNRGGQNNGRGAVAVQFVPEGGGGAQRVVLPSEVAERTLAVPLPTWDSKFGCSAGHFNTGTRCTACGPGRFNANVTVGLGTSACGLCPRGLGTNASDQGAIQCSPCAAGYVQDGRLHQGICHGCAAGTFRGALMPSTACQLCDAGKFSDATAMDSCSQCPTGTYQSDKGQTACVCNRGWFRHPSPTRSVPCLACDSPQILPGGTTRHSGSASQSECTCDRGYYLRAGACHSCEADFPKDSVVCDGFGAAPVLQKGWMTRAGELTVYLCPADGAGCPGGVEVGVERCAEGGSDIACAWCAEGSHYSRASGKCIACGSGATWLWVVTPVLALGVACALRPPTVAYSQKSLLVAIRGSFLSLTVSQILDVLQLYAIYGSSAIQFASEEESVFSGVGDVFSFSYLLCGISGDRTEHALKVVLLLNLLPAFFILWLVVCSLPALVFRPLKKLRFPGAIGACNMCLSMLVSFFTTVVNLAVNLVAASYAHPKIDKFSLLAFPYLTDDSSEMTGLYVVASCALSFYCLGTLLLVSFMCWYLQTDRPSTLVRRCTVALVVRHRDEMSWWLVVEMIQKLLVALSVAILKRPDQQMQWMQTVFVVYGMMLVYFKPYRFLRHTFFDIIFTWSKIQLLVLSVTSVYNRVPSQSGVLVLMFATLVVCVVDATWCLLSLARGNATNPGADRQTFRRVVEFLNLAREPFTLGEVLPDHELPRQLSDLRNARSKSKSSFIKSLSETVGVARSSVKSNLSSGGGPATRSCLGASGGEELTAAMQAEQNVEAKIAPPFEAGFDEADFAPPEEETAGTQPSVGTAPRASSAPRGLMADLARLMNSTEDVFAVLDQIDEKCRPTTCSIASSQA